MPAQIDEFLAVGEIRAVDQRARGPVAHDLDAVDGRTEVLVVALHDAHVPPDENQLARPLLLIGQDVADPLPHLLLHLEGALALLLGGHGALQAVGGAVVAASIRPHEGGGGEDVRVVDAPAGDDVTDGGVIERHERFPEE